MLMSLPCNMSISSCRSDLNSDPSTSVRLLYLLEKTNRTRYCYGIRRRRQQYSAIYVCKCDLSDKRKMLEGLTSGKNEG